ncbi:MAG: hypothetical protein HYS13_17680 [Planctomycetia bacterium]|nr:hypothetical protein [Planctomycetia bacterium]
MDDPLEPFREHVLGRTDKLLQSPIFEQIDWMAQNVCDEPSRSQAHWIGPGDLVQNLLSCPISKDKEKTSIHILLDSFAGKPVSTPQILGFLHIQFYLHHDAMGGRKGTRRRKANTLRVLDLPPSVFGGDLNALFSHYGPVAHAAVEVDGLLATGRVKMKTAAAARRACAGLDGYDLHGHKLSVRPWEDQVSNVPLTAANVPSASHSPDIPPALCENIEARARQDAAKLLSAQDQYPLPTEAIRLWLAAVAAKGEKWPNALRKALRQSHLIPRASWGQAQKLGKAIELRIAALFRPIIKDHGLYLAQPDCFQPAVALYAQKLLQSLELPETEE